MSHERYDDAVGAYLLGALPELEHEVFERHLMGCEDCRDQFEQLRPAAEALPFAVEPLNPSPALKAALMAEVEADVGRSAATEPAAPQVAGRSWRFRLGALRPAIALRPAMAWASAVVLVAFGVATGLVLDRVFESDDARTLAATVDSQRVPGASGSLLVPSEDGKGAILRVSGLPDPPPDHVYQVWLDREGEVNPVSLFAVTAAGTGAAAIPDDLEDADAVLVTREREGGARVPSELPLIRVQLPTD